MSMITIFPDAYNSDKPYYTTVEIIYQRIKSPKYRGLIEQIRSIEDKKTRDGKKKLLPSILFAGLFTKRLNNAITSHSGLICIDFDKLGSRLLEVKQMLMEDAHTHLLFASPSGNGLKCVFKIPANKETHSDSSRAIKAYFKDEPSYDHFPDVARICFISYDPDVYYNPDSIVFDKLIEAPKPVIVEQTEIISDYDQIYNNLKTWLEKKFEYYQDGNKHKYLVKLAGACNRFGVPRNITLAKLKYDFLNQASPVDELDFDKIVNKVFNSYASQNAISFFDRTTKVYEKNEGKQYVQIEEFVLPEFEVAKDVIYVSHVRQQILDTYENGYQKAETTYFNSIDNHWKWKKGECSLMSGIMNHGKTTLILQLMLIKSVKEGTKWAIFCPEQNPPDDFYDDLAHTYIGKSTQKKYRNHCTRAELEDALDFLDHHFFFIYPEKESPTPEYIQERFIETIVKHDIKGTLIDPFNQLDNDIKKYGGREDLYISAFGSNMKRFALQQQLYFLVNIHPNSGITKVKDKAALNYGNYECPDVMDLSGGAMWGNKFDNLLFTYRPYFSTDPQNTTVQFKSVKIKKQKSVGIPGTVDLYFNRITNRFYEEGERSPFPAPYFEEMKVTYNAYEHLNKWEGKECPF